MRKRHLALLAAMALGISTTGIANAHHPGDGVNEEQRPSKHSIHDGIVDTPLEAHRAHKHDQHGTTTGHVPGGSENLELVGRFNVPRTGGSIDGIVTDVWSFGTTAYMGTFAPPCSGLGVNVVDITDPSSPSKLNFISSRPGTRVNDVKVFHFEGLASGFSGELLLHSNENCNSSPQRVGGISIYDVSDPVNPVRMAEGVGDKSSDNSAGVEDRTRARQVHNVYAWQDGDRAFAAIVDDEELTDLDILEITDPVNPVHIADVGLPDWPGAKVDAFGDEAFLHDIWARDLGGTWTLLLSYWDAGFITVNVDDPADPTFIKDSDYPDPDPLVLANVGTELEPEGNAHAAAWDDSGDLILAGDEDFSAYRLTFEVTTAGHPAEGLWPAGEFSWTVPIVDLPDGTLNGPIVFGGYGCAGDRDQIPHPSILGELGTDEESIVVFQRGPVNDPNSPGDACFFSEKVESGELAGYDAVIIANHHNGSGGGSQPDAFICGSQGSAVLGTAHGLCIGHRFMHRAFERPEDYTIPYPEGDPGDVEPNVGDRGPEIEVVAQFDGWGPFHLLDGNSMREIDAWAPSEVYDPAFAQGFGDLTMHNVEPFGPGKAAIAWYTLGLRVLDFSGCAVDTRPGGGKGKKAATQLDPGCIRQAGFYIDPNGNNFWGVHVAWDHPVDPGLILASDRDSGLWIFDFSG